jgi:hypothetical protein
VSVKLAGVIVLPSIASEKAALTAAFVATPVAPSAGATDVTVGCDGGGGGAAVVKLQLLPAKAEPSPALIVESS